MKHRVAYSAGCLLTTLKSTTSSRRTLFHHVRCLVPHLPPSYACVFKRDVMFQIATLEARSLLTADALFHRIPIFSHVEKKQK